MSLRLLRLLALLLAVVLPMWLMAAGIVPIIGMPGHAHQPAAEQALDAPSAEARLADGSVHRHAHATPAARSVLPDAGAHDAGERGCPAHALTLDSAGDSLHGHGCPHLGMAGIAAPELPESDEPLPAFLIALPAAQYISIVLDILSPPPTARA